MYKYILFLSLLLFCGLNAQNEFEEWKKQQEKEFKQFKSDIDREFAEFLKKNWIKGEVKEGKTRDNAPKPKAPPTVPPKEIKKEPVETPTIEPVKDTKPEPMKTAEPDPVKEPATKPEEKPAPEPVKTPEVVTPPTPAPEPPPQPDATETVEVDYYTVRAKVVGIKGVNLPRFNGARNNENIAKYFAAFASLNYEPVLKSFLAERERLRLNDWGYMSFIYKASEKLYPGDADNRRLFTWVALLKSGYNVRVGYNDISIRILLQTDYNLYGTPYFKFEDDETRYYIAALTAEDKVKAGPLFSYKENMKDALKKFDVSLERYPVLGSGTDSRTRRFLNSGKPVNFSYTFSKGLVGFYDDYPQTNYSVYFSTPFSPEAIKSLEDAFLPALQGKSDFEKVDLLLGFCQTATGYKTDQEQFNREKPMFAEETLYYDFTDCEDRSVLFSWLVRMFTELEVVGLDYPGHIATAVAFKENLNGDAVTWKGKRFVICDPTYIGAGIGECMPEFRNSQPEIIEINKMR